MLNFLQPKLALGDCCKELILGSNEDIDDLPDVPDVKSSSKRTSSNLTLDLNTKYSNLLNRF